MAHPVIHIDVRKKLLGAEGEIMLDASGRFDGGTFTALFGPSGAGKTTLLRMLAGLTPPDEGTIRCGETIWFDSARRIDVAPQERHIGMMFQDYALFPNMTVEENIRFAQSGRDRSFTDQLIGIFGLGEFARTKPARLSGGQRQRVALARALARRPQLLLLDEPLSALDARMRTELQTEIARAHTMFGSTTVLVSHDLHEVFRLATNIMRIDHGRLTGAGTPEQLFADASLSGKFQVTGQIAAIEQNDGDTIVTIITGAATFAKVIASEGDIRGLSAGDSVVVSSNAFNPIIKKI